MIEKCLFLLLGLSISVLRILRLCYCMHIHLELLNPLLIVLLITVNITLNIL